MYSSQEEISTLAKTEAKSSKTRKKSDMTSDDISEITNSESAFTTSRSDVRSYRDKLKDRFQSVKHRSGKKTTTKKTFRSHANNILSLNKSLELMRRENVEIETQMRTYKRCESSEETVSKAEMYHFFCDEASDVVVDDERVSDDAVVVNLKAENKSEEMLQCERDLLWIPGREPLLISEKVEEQARNLSEEGLYVCETLKIPNRHLLQLERRLLAKDDRKWFDSAGNLKIIKDPYCATSYRPQGYSEPTELEICYEPLTANTLHDAPLSSVVISKNDLLVLHVHNVKFKHHPLFSAEHVFREKLITYYDRYREFVASNRIDRLNKKLQALRKSKTSLNVTIVQIKQVRGELFGESKAYRQNMKSMLHAWKALKKIRKTNEYSNTDIRLIIGKESVNYEEEKREYDCSFEDFVSDIVAEYELDHESKVKEYKELLREWKQDDTNPKPRKPRKSFDIEQIRTELQKKFSESFKPPGEPKLHFEISHDHETTKSQDNLENLRKQAVASAKIFLKFFCDDVCICKSKPRPLSENFTCHFDESFSVKLSTIPDHLVVEIYEQSSSLVKRKVANVDFKLPPKSTHFEQGKVSENDFVKEDVVHYKHTAVGSGCKMDEMIRAYNLENFSAEEVLNTAGFMTCTIAWDTDNFNAKEVTFLASLSKDVLDESGCIDLDKLNSWIQDNQLDPRDPRNSVIFSYLESRHKESDFNDSGNRNYFRCDPYLYPLEICDRAALDEDARFKLLGLRDQNVPEFVGMTVPNRAKEIPSNIFSAYKRRIAEAEDLDEYSPEKDEYEYDINTRRSHGRKCLRQMHTRLFQKCRNTDNNLTFEDVVDEKTIPLIELYIRNLLYNFFNWFKLRPTTSKPLPTKKFFEAGTADIIDTSCRSKIIIEVIGAINVPNRASALDSDKSNSSVVRPFLEVCHHKFTYVTSCGSGREPLWNEEVKLPLEANCTDYLSPNSFSGYININLFDNCDQEDVDKNNHWLGGVEIPIGAISQGKMEGLFLVHTAHNLQNYEQYHEQKNPRIGFNQSHTHRTYINMKINMEPNVPKLSPDLHTLPSSEPPYLHEHVLRWNERYNSEHPKRKFSALTIDSNNKTVCVVRFIKSLEPPQINADGFDITPEQCARYVATIPFSDCNRFYQNMWLTTEQLLKLGVGSIVDHAVTLTCYFMSLGMEVWLLLGFGIPHGSTAYVLIREYTPETMIPIHFVYDITTGLKYNITDPFCPLQRVYCVISVNNVWANCQRGDNIATTRFEFNRRFDWLPLFNKQITAPTNSAQQKLRYVSMYDIQKIQASIEKKVRKAVAKKRTSEPTTWNHYVCNLLKSAVGKFEISAMQGKSFVDLPELDELRNSYKICGYAIALPFSSTKNIVDKVLSTRLHEVEGRNVEFACGISVYPYPNHVLSIWIVMLSLQRKY